jgi:hypothetical protein
MASKYYLAKPSMGTDESLNNGALDSAPLAAQSLTQSSRITRRVSNNSGIRQAPASQLPAGKQQEPYNLFLITVLPSSVGAVVQW